MRNLKEHLKCIDKNYSYIRSLPKVYLIGYWARYGVIEFPYAGKMVEDEVFGMTPLVYDFTDHNGTYDEWVLRKIQDTTTGQAVIYCFDKQIAQRLADKLQAEYEYSKEKK